MDARRTMEGDTALRIFASTLDESETSVSRFGYFTLGEIAPGTHRLRGGAGLAPESVFTWGQSGKIKTVTGTVSASSIP
jgi:hypothetical protein